MVTLSLSGHAGFGAKGSDILCAGVSFLAETVCQTLESRFHERISGQALEPGQLELRVDLSENWQADDRLVLRSVSEVLIRGLRRLHDEYPKHLILKIIQMD